MSDSSPDADENQTPAQLQAGIEARRARLAAHVDALSEKLDVRTQAQEAVQDARARASEAVTGAVVEGSRTLVQKFRALPLPARAAVGAGTVALVVAMLARGARA